MTWGACAIKRISYGIAVLSVVTSLWFDWFVRHMEVTRFLTGAPGDFLTFRNNTLSLVHVAGAVVGGMAPLMYPPPFLLFVAPVALLPPFLGYLVWVAMSVAALVGATRLLPLSWRALALGMASQPVLFCAVTGQSGILVSAFLLVAFGLADAQPILAGIAAGLVIIKPQFGLLVPLCLAASRNWRAFAAAVVTVVALTALSVLGFGLPVWHAFYGQHASDMQGMLTAPWRTLFQITMVTPFVTLRSMHASLAVAGVVQAAVTIAAALAAWRLWRQDVPPIVRLAPTLCLVYLATPYAYTYDLPALALAVAAGAFYWRDSRSALALALLFAGTSLYAPLSIFSISWGGIGLVALLALVWPRPARLTSAA